MTLFTSAALSIISFSSATHRIAIGLHARDLPEPPKLSGLEWGLTSGESATECDACSLSLSLYLSVSRSELDNCTMTDVLQCLDAPKTHTENLEAFMEDEGIQGTKLSL